MHRMKKILIAMDSFKGSMTSLEAGEAAKKGILEVDSEAQVQVYPLADGGEGTMEALVHGLQGEFVTCTVTGPLGHSVEAKYGILSQTAEKTAVLEMAQAAGITLVEETDKNPYIATTFGVGEMICDALKRGCRHFILGIGGKCHQ